MSTNTIALCQICGEPMPAGEEMFNYHGYSGPCPKPPLPKPTLKALVEYYTGPDKDGEFYLTIHVDKKPYHQIGFSTPEERQRAQRRRLVRGAARRTNETSSLRNTLCSMIKTTARHRANGQARFSTYPTRAKSLPSFATSKCQEKRNLPG